MFATAGTQLTAIVVVIIGRRCYTITVGIIRLVVVGILQIVGTHIGFGFCYIHSHHLELDTN